jgi:hypothetical protein
LWCEIRRQAVKKKEYEKCIEKVDNEKMKEALIQAFDKDFPRIIELCDDDYTVVQIFVSLFEMLGEVQKVGMENVSFEKYVIGKAFPDYLKLLVGWLDCISSKEEKDKIFEIFDYVIRDIVVEFTCKGLKKGSITREMVRQWISGTDEKEKIERACEKGNAYKNLLESFHDLDEEDKLEEIIKGVFELRDFLEIVNKKYDENNEMLDVLEVTDTDEFSDKLDVIYSYVTSIKEEVAKLFEIANSYSKSFDI